MNTYKNKINQIKLVLGMEVKLAQEKLVDGTIVEAESFEPGYPVFVVTENGPTPAPMGVHETEGGLMVEVDDQGKIVSVTEKAAEESAEEASVEVEIEAAEEEVKVEEEVKAEEEEKPTEMEDIKETMKQMLKLVEEVVKEVAEVKTEMAEMKEKYAKFSKEPGATKVPKLTKEEFAASADDVLEAKIAALNKLKKEKFFK